MFSGDTSYFFSASCKFTPNFVSFPVVFHVITLFVILVMVMVMVRTKKITILSQVNPLTPMSDQERISPYSISTISTR